MWAFAEFEQALTLERQRERRPDLVTELRVRAGAGEKKADFAREFGTSSETLYQFYGQLGESLLSDLDKFHNCVCSI